MQPKAFFQNLLAQADIEIDGTRPWDVQIHDDRLYTRVLRYGSLAVGEGYMDGWWDCDDLDGAIYRASAADFKDNFKLDFGVILETLRATLLNPQRAKVTEVAEKHYDIGNDLYERMLDKRMIYSCGYWKDATTLDEAQEAKLDLICRKVGLEPGMTRARHRLGLGRLPEVRRRALRHHRHRHHRVARSRRRSPTPRTGGLPIETKLIDYMAMEGKFDRVISIGMFEHVGYKNYQRYMKKVRSLLKDDGLFLLHTIGGNWATKHGDPWVIKYIFPNGMIPGPENLSDAFAPRLHARGLAQFRPRLRQDADGLVSQFRGAPGPSSRTSTASASTACGTTTCTSSRRHFRVRHTNLWQLVLSTEGREGRLHAHPLTAGATCQPSSVEKWTYGNSSGICESQMPCALHAQPPESFAGGASRYVLNREKSIRQVSPSRGGRARPSLAAQPMPDHGIAISAVQPRSRSRLSLTVPSTATAHLEAGQVPAEEPEPRAARMVGRSRRRSRALRRPPCARTRRPC